MIADPRRALLRHAHSWAPPIRSRRFRVTRPIIDVSPIYILGPTIRTLALRRLPQIAAYETEQVHGAVRFGHIVVAAGGTCLLLVALHRKGTHGDDRDGR